MAGLPRRNKLLFTVSSLGSEALGQSRGLWLLYAYAPPADSGREALLPLGVVGVVLTAGKLIEAFDDALIGWWSDRTRSRLGRRLPFILGATPLWALFAFLTFVPPENSSTATTVIYLFVTYELFNLFVTLSGGPYEALLPELAASSRDRVTLVALRVYFGVAGAAIGLVGSGLLVDRFGFRAMALVMALLAFGCRYLGMAGIWKHVDRHQPPADLPLLDALRATFSNTAFLLFLPTFVLFQLGLQLLTGVLPYYVTSVLGKENEGVWSAILTAVVIGAMVVAVPVFGRLAQRTSKRQAFSWAMLGAAAAFPLLAFAGFVPGIPVLPQVLLVIMLIGFPLAGVYLFPTALTADIVDDDASRTGHRREATFYGAQNFVEKTAGSLAPLVLTSLLLLGNTANDPLGVRIVGPVAGAVVLIGYLVFRQFDLPDEVVPIAPLGTAGGVVPPPLPSETSV